MSDLLKIHSILGDVANVNHRRAWRDGAEFEGVLPRPTYTEEVVFRDARVTDTVAEMKKVIRKYAWQTAKLAPMLKGSSTYSTCRNIWNFLFDHIKYKEDDEGKEQLRTPALSWAVRRSRGIDCDDFTIFAGTLLYNLNIPDYIRIARYAGKDYFQHVYPVIPLTSRRYITLDAVLDEYDAEKPPAETKDFLIMNSTNLNGIDVSVLGGVDDDTTNEISGILSGIDFHDVNELEGLGNVASREQELQAIKNHLIRTRRFIARHPKQIEDVEHPKSFLGMLDYSLKYWDTDKRDEALGILAGEEDKYNELEGMSGYDEGHEDVDVYYGTNGLGGYHALGKAKRQKKFFSKVKQAVKKAGQGIKKIAKTLIRYNPLTVTIRAAVLLALKVNLLKVSSKFKWGYLTEQEAQARGFNMNEWRKLKKNLGIAENLFVKVLQGKAENFKRAMLTGRGGKLNGLGFVVAATTAASTTAAVPFITKLINLLKNVNYKKLLETVSSLKLKGKTKAEQTDEVTQDGESAQPEGGQVSEEATAVEPLPDENGGGSDKQVIDSTSVDKGSDDEEVQPNEVKAGQGKGTAEDESGEAPAEAEGGDTTDLPAPQATKSLRATPVDNGGGDEEPGFFAKIGDWVKENKLATAGIITTVAVAGILIYKAVKPKHGLGKAGRGKKKKGKAKNHPPQALKGTKQKSHSHHPKNRKKITL